MSTTSFFRALIAKNSFFPFSSASRTYKKETEITAVVGKAVADGGSRGRSKVFTAGAMRIKNHFSDE